THRLADDLRVVEQCCRRDLSGYDDHARLGERLAGDACVPVLREDRIENGIGDVIADLVRVPLRNRLRGELITCHARLRVELWKPWAPSVSRLMALPRLNPRRVQKHQ